MYSSVRRRIVHGLGANGLGQLINIGIKLVSVPFFLHYWGIELYGEWLLLSVIPAYFAMSDIGLGSVAGSEMTMQLARGDRKGVLSTFQSVGLLIHALSALAFIGMIVAVLSLPFAQWFGIQHISEQDVTVILILLTMHVLAGLQGGLISAGFRCAGYYPLAVHLQNAVRFLEFFFVVVVIILQGSPVDAALVFFFVRAFGTGMAYLVLQAKIPWLGFGFHHARRAVLARLLKPAIAFLAFPLGNALSLEGMILVVGLVANASAVVTFSTLRTLTRFALQMMTMINSSVWPELSRAFGSGNMALARKIHRHSYWACCWISIVIALIFYLTGDWIIRYWTDGQVKMNHALFTFLLTVIFANALWMASGTVLAATNHHQRAALFYLVGTGVSLVIAYVSIPVFSLPAAGAALLAIDTVVCIYVVKMALELLGEDVGLFFKAVWFPMDKRQASGWLCGSEPCKDRNISAG